MYFCCVKCSQDPSIEGLLVAVSAGRRRQEQEQSAIDRGGVQRLEQQDGGVLSILETLAGARCLLVFLINMEFQAQLNMHNVARVHDSGSACGPATVVTKKANLPTTFGITIYYCCLIPGVLLKSVVWRS